MTSEAEQQPLVGRFELPAAPRGLRLVQDLINTALAHQTHDERTDLLADLVTARAWLDQALSAWTTATGGPAPSITLDESDLAPLRDHRELLRATLRTEAGVPGTVAEPGVRPSASPSASREISARTLLTIGADGRASYEPLESGWRGIRALTSMETLLAQTTDTWSRLKTCAYQTCGACFYDWSPNRARVWHDTKTCGNITNLRASRTRRRAGA